MSKQIVIKVSGFTQESYGVSKAVRDFNFRGHWNEVYMSM